MTTIRLKPDGPYLLDGEFTILDEQGREMPVIKRALCRCGGSTTKPFCDGTHSRIGFRGAGAAVEQSEKKGE